MMNYCIIKYENGILVGEAFCYNYIIQDICLYFLNSFLNLKNFTKKEKKNS